MSGGIHERSDGSWREVAAQKEQEWRDVLEQHVNSLEMTLNNKEKELIEEKRRFDLLREDFEYNLQLVSERDEELEKFDALFGRMKEEEAKHNARVSELLIALDKKSNEVEMEKRNHEDLRIYYQQRLKEKEVEGEQWRLGKEAEMKAEREDCDRLRRRLQHQISDLSVDLEAQRRELNGSFDEALMKKEHEFQSKFDELHSEKVAADHEVKQLRRELELVRINQQRTAGDLENECGTRQMMEKRIKELQWEVSDVKSMKDAELADLQSEIKQLQRTVLRCQEERNSLDRIVKERESQLDALRQSALDRENEFQKQITELESHIEMGKTQQRQLQWAHRDAMAEKGKQIQRAQTLLSDCQHQLDSHRTESSKMTVTQDIEMKKLLTEQKKMEIELVQKDEAINRYKRELTAGIGRERDLEQSKVQLELEWDQKCRERERSLSEQQEQLISSLCRARDEALVKVQEKELELKQRDNLINSLTREQDQTALHNHGPNINSQVGSEMRVLDVEKGVLESRLYELEEQNKKLRIVIRQMREAMESMGQSKQETPISLSEKSFHTSDVEELKEIRAENQTLQKKNEELSTVNRQLVLKLKDVETGTQNPDSPLMRAHVRAMNETIGSLRAEKLELQAENHRLTAKVAHLSSMLTKADEEFRSKQVQVEHLQYEMATSARRSSSEAAELKRRVTELELALEQVQRVADEYHRSSVEKNTEVTSLRNQVSALKLDVAARVEQGMSVEHAAVVADLEEEIHQLKKQLSNGPVDAAGGYSSVLKQKLKSASRRIVELSRERQQLIDISNTLRAEMQKPKEARTLQVEYLRPTSQKAAGSMRNSEELDKLDGRKHLASQRSASKEANRPLRNLAGKLNTKLDAAEHLHYDLKRQELQLTRQGVQLSPTDIQQGERFPSKHNVKDLKVQPELFQPTVGNMSSDSHELEQQSLTSTDDVLPSAQHAPPHYSSSSLDDANQRLRDVWDTLLEGETAVAGFTPKSDHLTGSHTMPETSRHPTGEDKLLVAGQRTQIQSRPGKSEIKQSGLKTRRSVGLVKNRTRHVRNYNKKDS